MDRLNDDTAMLGHSAGVKQSVVVKTLLVHMLTRRLV